MLYLIANVAAVILCSILLFSGGVYVDRFMISRPEMVFRVDDIPFTHVYITNNDRDITSNAKFNECDNERDKLLKQQAFLNRQLNELQSVIDANELKLHPVYKFEK